MFLFRYTSIPFFGKVFLGKVYAQIQGKSKNLQRCHQQNSKRAIVISLHIKLLLKVFTSDYRGMWASIETDIDKSRLHMGWHVPWPVWQSMETRQNDAYMKFFDTSWPYIWKLCNRLQPWKPDHFSYWKAWIVVMTKC